MMLRLLFTLLLISSTFYAELVKVPDSFQIKFHQVKFSGNTVFPNVELEGLLKNYIDKPIAIDKIHEAKELVTKYYISHGYVNSGAVLPDQDITSGILEIKIIEGKLEKLTLTQNTRFSEQYLWGRVEEYADQPLHFPSLQLPLYFLHADRTISRVNAELQPTEIFGKSELKLALEERELITFSVEPFAKVLTQSLALF